jgi:hypothetical protein
VGRKGIMVSLLVWVLVLGVIAFIISKMGIPSPFKEIAFIILCILLIYAVLTAFAVPMRL